MKLVQRLSRAELVTKIRFQNFFKHIKFQQELLNKLKRKCRFRYMQKNTLR